MANVKIDIHNRSIKTRKEGIKNWKVHDVVKKSLLKFLDELALGKVNKGVKISEGRQSKYIDILKIPLEYWNKPENKLTMKDIEKFEKDLSSGKIKSRKEEAYSKSTKVDIRRGLKVYLKWKLGETKANQLTDWLDTREIKTTPD